MAVESKIDLEIFRLVFETIAESHDLDTMAGQLTQLLVGVLDIKGAAIFILNPELEELELLASSGLSIDYINKGPIIADKSIKFTSNREPVIVRNISTSKKLQYPEKAHEEGIKAIISLPINLRGTIIGALRLYHSDEWEISSRDVEILQTVAQNIGISMIYFRVANALETVKQIVEDVHPVWL